MARITHFDISGVDPENLVSFYEEIFGWTFNKWDNPSDSFEYWLITTGPKDQTGIDGGLSRRQKDDPVSMMNTIEVEDLDATMESVKKKGGTIVQPKSLIEGVGWFATFSDPEKNLFGIMQPLSSEN